jgi:hypothetical protein
MCRLRTCIRAHHLHDLSLFIGSCSTEAAEFAVVYTKDLPLLLDRVSSSTMLDGVTVLFEVSCAYVTNYYGKGQ